MAAIPARRDLAWRPTLDDVAEVVSRGFGVDRSGLLAGRRPGNHGRLVAVHLARRLTAEAVGAIGRYFGGVSTAAISKTVQRVAARQEADPSWESRLAGLAAELANPRPPAGSRPTKLQVEA